MSNLPIATPVANPSIFNFQSNHTVRIVLNEQGEPLFCLKDVCGVLAIQNHKDLLAKQLDKQGVEKIYLPTESGNQHITFINEPNLYRVIFRSNKAEARQFQDWVFNEVLPAIRKTGKYQAPTPSKEYLSNQDWDNLKRLVWLCEKEFFCKKSAGYAIWKRLREVTGVKSPEKFEVQHLPILAQEFNRLLTAIEAFGNAKRQAEATFIKHILRYADDEMLSHLIEDVANQEFHQQLQQQLPTVFNRDCLALINRS